MKPVSAIFVTLFLISSCQTEKEVIQYLKNCDELNIIYLSKDTFVFKTFDSSTISNFVALITKENDNTTNTCESTERLVFKKKGNQIFSAEVSTKNLKGCNTVSYYLGSKLYRHRLTYRTGMGIDQVYWHKIDPIGNPWPEIDSTKFRYEDIKNNR